ncbi:MAG: ABC transporter permease [Parachlamydiaceae bacterium]
MFELSVACKYLIPRRRQLSVSLISLISILVIALVVWLIVVFFSVTDGLEKNWVQKLTALTAPLRITPTDAYYHSYYYLVDSVSEASNYSSKTIKEKLESPFTDPYDPTIDQEIPPHWPEPDRYSDGSLKDPVKLVYDALNGIKSVSGLHGQDFELTATHIQLRLLRQSPLLHANNVYGGSTESALSYPAFLGNFEIDNPHLEDILLPINKKDLTNFLSLFNHSNQDLSDEEKEKRRFETPILKKQLKYFFNSVTIKKLESRPAGWNIPRSIFPFKADWNVGLILKEGGIIRLIVPQNIEELPSLLKTLEEQGLTVAEGRVLIQDGRLSVFIGNQKSEMTPPQTLTLAGGASFEATLDPQSIDRAQQIDDLRFEVVIPIQGTILKGNISYRGLEIAQADTPSIASEQTPSFWVYRLNDSSGHTQFHLPNDPDIGEGIVLPKSFRDVGVMLGDRGALSYLSPTASTLQEQQIPVYVAGFYDPGIIPIGGKFILANQEVTSLIRASHQGNDNGSISNGINVRFDDLAQADLVKQHLLRALKEKGIARYWNIETYREYEFTQEIMRELQSQKHLFMVIAVVIILVACSNIISMLVILVNDKKMEIGILRSMGASSKSIALIFGLSGALIGVLGSLIGIAAAILTLQNLNGLVGLLSRMQGHDMFSANLYGKILPSDLSYEALCFVLIATGGMSLLAGIVPAIKACSLRPSEILRSGGG